MKQGARPTGHEAQAAVPCSVRVHPVTAYDLSRRVKAARLRDPDFSRNDLFREIIRDYQERHPRPAKNGSQHAPAEACVKHLFVKIAQSTSDDIKERLGVERIVDPLLSFNEFLRRMIVEYQQRHPLVEESSAKVAAVQHARRLS